MSWFGGGAAASQQAMMRQLEDMQKEDSMRTFNSVVERCFFNCVNSFATSDLEPREEQCVYRCTEKFFRHSQRVARVFAEQSVLMGNVPGDANAMQQQQQALQQQQQQQQQSK